MGEVTKQLQAFWHWFDNEKPYVTDAAERVEDCGEGGCICVEAHDALIGAAGHICHRQRLCIDAPEDELIVALERHPEALRDLSLSLCEALERMREVVPEAKREEWRATVVTSGWISFGMNGTVVSYDPDKYVLGEDGLKPLTVGNRRRCSETDTCGYCPECLCNPCCRPGFQGTK